MRFIIAFSVFAFGISHSMAVEKPQYNHPKEQWVVLTRPIIGCDAIENIDWSEKAVPKLSSALEAGKPIQKWTTSCYLLNDGEKYLLEPPTNGFTTLLSVCGPHCTMNINMYTKAKGTFYKNIPAPVSPPLDDTDEAHHPPFNGQHVPVNQLLSRTVSLGDQITYGWYAGEDATIKNVSGLNTDQAMIVVKITKKNATEYCYSDPHNPPLPNCVQDMMARPFPDYIYANCLTGDFMDFEKRHYHFGGKYIRKSDETFNESDHPKWVIKNLASKEILANTVATRYITKLGIFRALCPASVNGSDDY